MEAASPTPSTKRKYAWPALLLVLAVGLICRAVLLPLPGHEDDVRLFYYWTEQLTKYPLAQFHEKTPGCNYPPLYPLILKGVGHLESWLTPHLTSWFCCEFTHKKVLHQAIRLPACLADLAAALLLFYEGRRVAGGRWGVVAASLYFLNPVSIYNSAYWGQVDGIHSAFLVWALVAANRMKPTCVGIALGLALLQKLQSVAFVPLFLLDVYRWRRWRGLGMMLLGAVFSAALVCAPYALTGSLPSALKQGYVDVVGQYKKLSVNAYNPWFLTGRPEAPDDGVIPILGQYVSGGNESIAFDAHPILQLTWKRLSFVIYVTFVALCLSLYAGRSGWATRSLGAGVLGLVFFLALTEMHERYLHPVFALLPLWAISGMWRERAYMALSFLALINVIAVEPAKDMAGLVGGLLTFVLLILMGTLARRRGTSDDVVIEERAARLTEVPPRGSWLILAFRVLTALWVAVLAAGAGYQSFEMWRSGLPRPESNEAVLYLSDLKPVRAVQDYGKLRLDRSMEGGLIRLGDRLYFRGLGMHASGTVEYEIPPGYDRFEAKVGIDRHFTGSAEAIVYLDDEAVFQSPVLTPLADAAEISVPLGDAHRLRLVVKAKDGNKGDHVDWALARLVKPLSVDKE